MDTPVKRRPLFLRWWFLLFALIVALGVLFVVNGVFLAANETPLLFETSAAERVADPQHVRIVAYNIAKCFVLEGKLASTAEVRGRLAKLAEIIRKEDPDFVFLSESVVECAVCPVNQVKELAEATDMRYWAFGENYNFGIPGFRMVGGNAILSRQPIEAVANPSLAGRKPFYVTKNNRRILWCKTTIAGQELMLGSVHNDSFEKTNNEKQVRQILDFAKGRDAVLAGDFNAMPDSPSIQLFRDSGRFAGNFTGPPTFPAEESERRIDFVFAPAGWRLIEERIISDPVTDHCGVVATFAAEKK